MGGGVWT